KCRKYSVALNVELPYKWVRLTFIELFTNGLVVTLVGFSKNSIKITPIFINGYLFWARSVGKFSKNFFAQEKLFLRKCFYDFLKWHYKHKSHNCPWYTIHMSHGFWLGTLIFNYFFQYFGISHLIPIGASFAQGN
ncbi:hypothetical protein ACJX0J_012854, partial [Zea mays]